MQKTLVYTALVGMIILINPGVAVYSQPSVSTDVDGAIAQVDEAVGIPPPVSEGLELYKAGKVEAAVNKWVDSLLAFIKDFPLEPGEDPVKREEGIGEFNKFRPTLTLLLTAMNQQYGSCSSYRVMKSIKGENNTLTTYLDTLHKTGSVYMMFITMKTEKGWRIIGFNFSPDIEEIFK